MVIQNMGLGSLSGFCKKWDKNFVSADFGVFSET